MKLLPAVISAFLCGWVAPSAQQEPSPLIGKTVLVFNPVPGDTLYVDMSGTGYPMAAAPGNWMSLTIPATIQFHINKFGLRNAYGQGNFWLGRTGLVNVGADAFSAADFAGGDSLWIIIDPAGPATAPPLLLTQAPKSVNILNPWEATAPTVVLPGNDKRLMRTLPGHCGWFTSFLFRPADLQVFFEEINGDQKYGKDGPGTSTPYDLAALFAAHPGVTALWLDTDRNVWLPAFPGKEGFCRYLLAATVRDFSGSHPDFGFSNARHLIEEGMVEDVLGVTGGDREPVRSAKVPSVPVFKEFESWWNADSTHADPAMRSYETCVDLPMGKTHEGAWEFDSDSGGSPGFFPIESFANPNNERTVTCTGSSAGTRNMNFCTEIHAAFIYRKGQKIEYRGDDDAWMFIDGRLVMDMGGLHGSTQDTVDLDKLGLTEGSAYHWDLFACERQICAASLRIKASMVLMQAKPLFVAMDSAGPGPVRLRIMKRSGTGSCAGLDTSAAPPVPASTLAYHLVNSQGEVMDTLAEGSHFAGGIVIATPSVTVDTSKLANILPPGAYRVAAFDPANSTLRVEIPIQVGQVSTSLRPGAKVHPRIKMPRLHDALGRARQGRSATFNR